MTLAPLLKMKKMHQFLVRYRIYFFMAQIWDTNYLSLKYKVKNQQLNTSKFRSDVASAKFSCTELMQVDGLDLLE